MVEQKLSPQSTITLGALLTAQTNSIAVLSKSSLPSEVCDETIKALSDLITLTLNMAKTSFSLNDDEVMSLLTLTIIKALKITND